MITHLGPEPGGEAEGIIRLEMSVPFSRAEVIALRDCLHDLGWSIEVEQIDEYLNDPCPAGGEHSYELHEEAGTGRTGWACAECHHPQPPERNQP